MHRLLQKKSGVLVPNENTRTRKELLGGGVCMEASHPSACPSKRAGFHLAFTWELSGPSSSTTSYPGSFTRPSSTLLRKTLAVAGHVSTTKDIPLGRVGLFNRFTFCLKFNPFIYKGSVKIERDDCCALQQIPLCRPTHRTQPGASSRDWGSAV